MNSPLSVGLDRLASDPGLESLRRELRKSRVALLAHPASVSRGLTHALDVLEALEIKPVTLFGPEHGWAGEAQDMIGVTDDTKKKERPIISLYGERFEDLSPKKEHLQGIDVVIIDLQDVGARYYTYIWTAVLMARACRDHDVRVIVLDRPNPIGITEVEGRLQDPEYLSFVGLERIPIRHGLTLGEIVSWRARVEGYAELITVIGSSRNDGDATTWDRDFVMPSPNMPTYDTALVYPGGCLLEGTNLSEGRGTTRPFEITGAPWIDGARLARDLQSSKALRGFIARPLSFEPTFHKHAKESCGGIQIHITDSQRFRPVATYVALIAFAHHQRPDRFAFRTEKYEFVDDKPAFDLLTGSARAREAILANEDPIEIATYVSGIGKDEVSLIKEARLLRRA